MDRQASIDGSVELGAINEMLSSIGESPVSTLSGEANVDVANARRILHNVNREIQSQGWTFNIEQNVELQPDVFSNLIPYELDILSMRSSQTSTPYVNLGGYVYDRLTRTDLFEAPIIVDIIRQRDLVEMPECFRRWIVARASNRFASRFFGDPSMLQILAREENEARIECNEYELDFGNYNVFTGDSYIQQLINRG